MKIYLAWCFTFAALLLPTTVLSASLSAQVSGSTITIEASELSDIAGIDLHFSYAPTMYSVSSATNGSLFSSGLFAPNLQRAGYVRIGIVQAQPVNGSGTIATIYGSAQGEGLIGIHSFRASGIAPDGRTVALQTRIINLDNYEQKGPEFSTESTGATANKSFVPKTESVSRASERLSTGGDSDKNEQGASGSQLSREREPYTPAKMLMLKSDLYNDGIYRKGVFQQFIEYGGDKSADKLLEMFTQWIEKSIPQDPPIKITSDNIPLRVTVPGMGENNKGFAILGGTSLSERSVVSNSLELEILPNPGTSSVKIVIFDNSKRIDFPLTVAAFVETDLNEDDLVDRADLDLYLANKDLPKYDFDQSGKTDSFDEYLYMLNYLSRLAS